MTPKEVNHIAWRKRVEIEDRGRAKDEGAPWYAYLDEELRPYVALLVASDVGSPDWIARRDALLRVGEEKTG